MGYRWIYLMLIPCIAYFVIFKYVPMYGIQLAFKDYVLKGIAASPWNDFAHFKYMMSEPQFLPALRNTLIISFYRILFGFPFPILLAIMINEVYMPRYKKVLQTIYTFPHFLTWVVMAGIMLNLLGSTGMVRKICELFVPGIGENWNLLYNKSAFRSILVISDIWKEAGWGTIIYLASITGIDQSLYEAATIDGANRFQRIWYITIPGIMNMIAIQFVLRVGAVMEGGFDQIFNLYTAPVYDTGDIIDTYIYRLSFVKSSGVNLGFPTAVGLFKNVINFILLMFTYVLVYMLEKTFGYVSSITLVELSNINNPILKKLSETCPGTFQHSLQVSILASEAAAKIGANAQLVRTGALYHDIGKMSNPVFFTENQSSVNPHNQLSFDQSAQIIISHVTEGVKIAEKALLPKAVISFIRTHHGRGKAKYFYNSFKNQYPDKPINDELFTYPGPNPFSKETAVLMMADSVEAASRSLKEHTEESISALVNKIIDGQIADGLLKSAPLTFKDVETIKSVFVDKLKTMFHTRISYPDLKKQ